MPTHLNCVLQLAAQRQILLDREACFVQEFGEWNIQDQVPLYEVPQRLQQAVLTAEDRRFYNHRGVDWLARMHAIWQGVKAGRNVRGAVASPSKWVRMLVPRPRNLWSENGLKALMRGGLSMWRRSPIFLSSISIKCPTRRTGAVLWRRRVYYFNRDLDTLDGREMLTLAILPRAPSGFDPYRGGAKQPGRRSIHLASEMRHAGLLSGDEWEQIIDTPLTLERTRFFFDRTFQNLC